jgi:hypothetical protein
MDSTSMPLLLSKKINPYSAYAVWKIAETEAQLLELSHITPPEMQSNKRSEWMVSRILVKYLVELFDLEYHGMDSLPTGKPYLIDQRAEISISHSFPFAPNQPKKTLRDRSRTGQKKTNCRPA